jgi:malonyl CoA-acyl carrier protein transacylase
MGRDLFDRFPDWTTEADAVLGYSIRTLCVDDPRSELGLTAFTQPALFVVNAMTYRARGDAGGVPPAFLAGHSLGEYNALVAAGALDFGTALRLVRRRGELMGQVSGGGMAAIIGLAPVRIEAILAGSDEGRRLDVANFNSFEQTVIAGHKDDLSAVKPAIAAAGGRYIPLKVSAPFHSRYMRDTMLAFSADLASVSFRPPSIPVVSNVTATPYEAAAIGATLARQIDHSVRWLDSIVFMLENGVRNFEETGPGTVLAKLAAQIHAQQGAGPNLQEG